MPPTQPVAFTRPRAPITWILIALNVAVFVLMTLSGISAISPSAYQGLLWGATYGPLVAHGQQWRLFTACFVHFGIIHIGFNMYVLWQIGLLVEPLFGSALYLLLYLAAGVGGNIVGYWLHPNIVAAGASGAIFGLFGGLLGYLLVRRRSLDMRRARPVIQSVGIFLVYNLAFGLMDTHTDLTAHFGGLVTGFLVGCVLAPLAPRLQPV